MSFTNAQFEQIKRIYDERRMLNGQESDRRLEYAEKTIPGFSKIRDRMVSLSMEMAKKLALGEETTCEEYKKEYADLVKQKRDLLVSASLPQDYLDPI